MRIIHKGALPVKKPSDFPTCSNSEIVTLPKPSAPAAFLAPDDPQARHSHQSSNE
jgi:hypothetical protein